MERLVQEINQQHTRRKRWRRIWSLAAGLAAFVTTYVLILPAITMSRQLVCGKAEHTHVESCYAQDALICNIEEHSHSEFCYDIGPADANADVETPEDWEKALSKLPLSGNRGADVAAVAMTQLGYQESSRNYVYTEGWPISGYTRYGAWYGKPYGEWDAMFVSFVLHYAGVDDLGRAEDANAWAKEIAQELPQRYRTAGVYQPELGDLVFFDRDLNGEIDGVGILAASTEDAWRVMEGNTEDAVTLVNYAPGDHRIAAYGLLADPEEPVTVQAVPSPGPLATTSEPTPSTASATGSIELKKQIEKLGGVDDYSYRLHLTLDGSNLKAGSTSTQPTQKRRIGILLDVTETMTARGECWDGSGNKFDVVWSILREKDGLLDTILDGNTEVFVIKVGSASTGDDRMGLINSGTILSQFTFSGSGNSLHQSQPISYVTGLNAAEKYLGDDLDSLVFIVGNETTHYESYKGGVYDRTQSGARAAENNYKDYEKFMANHPKLSMYMLGVASQNGTLEHHSDCGEYTAEKWGAYSKAQHGGGGYFKASNKTELKDQLTQIAQQIKVPGDKVEGIEITDTLSDYVEMADAYAFAAYLKQKDSKGIEQSKEVTSDVAVKLSEDKRRIACTYPGPIDGPFKLEIAFNIKTKDTVYQPYLHTGSANTDWETNDTSSLKPGFYSNTSATTTYTLNDITTKDQPSLDMPVVQAPEKATIQVTKKWENVAEQDKKPVTVELHRGSASGDLIGTVELNAGNSWTADVPVKILKAQGTSNEVFVVERAIKGFTASYSAQSVSAVADKTHPITVTNTKQAKTAKLTVTKHWQNVSGTAKIHVCKEDGASFTDIGDPFEVSSGADGSKEFTITWTEPTPPEVYIYEERSDDFYPLFSGDGTATKVAIGDTEYSAMKLEPQADETYTVTLTNMAAAQMPETGGPGTQLYVFSGLALIFSAALLMQIRKIQAERRAT